MLAAGILRALLIARRERGHDLSKRPRKTLFNASHRLADGVGFEPTVGLSPTPVFKTGALNRSATHPA